jgi:hypothetical protein
MTADHLRQLGSVLFLLHLVALAIVNTTTTPRDDEALDRAQRALVFVYRLIEAMAGVGPVAKR